MPKISFIVPVYNVKKYLPRCLDSIVAQTYSDWQCIAVDDGSKDGSGSILDEYAKKDERFIPIHKENGGVSSARNVALDIAKGDYICFVDADDWLEKEMAEYCLNKLDETNADFIQFGYINRFDERVGNKNNCINKTTNGSYETVKEYFLGNIMQAIWGRLYKRELTEGVRFDESLAVGEDSEFIFCCCKKTEKAVLVDEAFYNYYQRSDSVMHSNFNEKVFQAVALLDRQKEKIEKEYKPFIAYREVTLCYDLITRILREGCFTERKKELRKRILSNFAYILFYSHFSLKHKVGAVLLAIWPELFYKLYKRGR